MSQVRVDGRVALVTGGTRGIGKAIAAALAQAGATVVVCGRAAPEAATPGVAFIACDVRDPAAATALVDEVGERHGGVDILVNNAGGAPHVAAAEASARFSERVVALNLLAPLNLSQAAYRWMRRGGRDGAIVNIASVSAVRPSPGTAAYAAAKAGLLALTQTLAHEWGPQVRVNAVIVGYVETEAVEQTYGDAASQAAIASKIAAGRLAKASEIADAVLFLASPMASYVTGAALHVDGGGERAPFFDIMKGQADG